MAVIPGVWGIDIGQCALKAVRLQLVDGVVTATAFDYVEHPKILSQPDANPDDLTREALDKFLSRNPVKGDKVAIGVPGQSGLARFVKLPPVEQKKIDDIVKFEAKQQIPFPLEEVVWDYQKVSEGLVEGGFAIDTEIGLFAMKRDMINRFLNHFQSVNVEVHVIQMTPLALCNYITYDQLKQGAAPSADAAPAPAVGKKKCVVALDIGTDGSNLIITDGGKIIWQRPIPIGGNHFTRALTKEMKLTFAKAEHLKRNAAKSPELASILKALKPVLTDFVGEVQRSLGYFTNTHRDAQVEYMVGLGSAFKLPGLQKYLGDKLQIRIEKPTKFNMLAGEAVTNAPVFVENILTFPVAFGLALQGLGKARLVTNLLPPEISWDRKIRAKKPWAVAAAALLMVGTGVLAYGYSAPYAAVNDPSIGAALEKGKSAQSSADTVNRDIAAKKAEEDAGALSLQAILAGSDERANWLAVNTFINSCLPMPGAEGNLKGNVVIDNVNINLESLWKSQDGDNGNPIRATEKYFERIKKGVDPKLAAVDDDMRQYLAAVDVEAVHCRFTRDLDGFFKEAKKFCYEYVGDKDSIFMGMEEPDRSELMADNLVVTGNKFKADGSVERDQGGKPIREPIKEGWVFEVRGTTWYELKTIKAMELLRYTLLRNLQHLSKSQKPDKETAPWTLAPVEIRDHINHLFLYNVWRVDDPRPDTFTWITPSLIDEIQPADWTPISKGTAGTAQGGGSYKRTPGQAAAGNDKKADDPKKKVKPRHEFVIVFVWREPTPPDRFMPKLNAAPPAQTGNQQNMNMGLMKKQ